MKPFFTEADFPGFEKPMSLEHRLDCAARANAKTALLLRQIESDKLAYDMIVEQHNAGLEQISRLEGQNEVLKEALKQIMTVWNHPNLYNDVRAIARVALREEK